MPRVRALTIAVLLIAAVRVQAGSVPVDLFIGDLHDDRFMGIRMLGAVLLPEQKVDGIPMSELSGLAWDEDDNLLYAVSDNGDLFHFKPEFKGDRLTAVQALAAYPLLSAKGKRLTGRESDSEGLVLRNSENGKAGDTELLVSFERKPRISRYDNRGRLLGDIELPAPLRHIGLYRSENKSLEALTEHPVHGILTAPEWPLKQNAKEKLVIYSQSGGQWTVGHFPEAKSALVAMETLPDGSLLLLERSFESIFSPLIIALRQVRLSDECLLETGRRCASRTLAVMDTTRGWNIDNFEGLTRYRGNRYFMVSDDNDSAIQRTLLFHFELSDADKPSGFDQGQSAVDKTEHEIPVQNP